MGDFYTVFKDVYISEINKSTSIIIVIIVRARRTGRMTEKNDRNRTKN